MKEDWTKWVKEIPYIKIPNDSSVQPLPPFGGAMARFKVIAPSGVFTKDTLSRNFTSMLWDQVPQDTLVSVSNDEIDWHTYRFHKFANSLYGVYMPEDFLNKIVDSNVL